MMTSPYATNLRVEVIHDGVAVVLRHEEGVVAKHDHAGGLPWRCAHRGACTRIFGWGR